MFTLYTPGWLTYKRIHGGPSSHTLTDLHSIYQESQENFSSLSLSLSLSLTLYNSPARWQHHQLSCAQLQLSKKGSGDLQGGGGGRR